MLKLIVENTKADNPTMVVRWCIDPTTFNRLRDSGVYNPSILIVVYNVPSKREYRYVEKMSALMRYIPFHTPGENRIFATLCWNTENGTVADRFLSKEKNRYRTTVLREGDSGFLPEIEDVMDKAQAVVQVDQRLFPKKPRDWEWVNSMFSTKPVDQCAFRRRRFFAYTVQLVIVLFLVSFYVAVMGVTAIVTLIIGRVPDWSIMFPHGAGSTEVTPKDVYHRQPYYFKRWYLKPFRPIFVLPALAIGWVWGSLSNATSVPMVMLSSVLLYVAIVVYTIFMSVIVRAIARKIYAANEAKHQSAEWRRTQQKRYEERERRSTVQKQQKAENERRRIANAEAARELAVKKQLQKAQRALCSFVDQKDPLAVPQEAMTASLRFNNLKRKVCRPYAD